MAQVLDPANDNPGEGGPGDPGYIPPTGSDTKIAIVTTNSGYTFTEAEIAAAGGPWPVFSIRVTPVNDYGSGTAAEVDYPPP
jgi:hypothetical protein